MTYPEALLLTAAALLAVWVVLRLAGDVLAWWARDEDGGWHE